MFGLFNRKPKPKPGNLSLVSTDPEVDGLRAEVGKRQAKVAELEMDLLESHEALAAFQREFEARLRPHLNRMAELQERIKAARRATLKRLWEESRSAPKFVDVEEQFKTAWTETDLGEPPPPPPPVTADTEQQIRALYRELAKRFHPDLAATEAERVWRTPRMAEVNAAYSARDLAALQRLAATADAPETERVFDSREALIASLGREIERLDELIEKLEVEFEELTNSPALQMKLDATMARRAGRDLIREAARELEREIEALERELEELG
jgi:predicted  nucleic acid-binding Zn-ribbon protein